MATDYSAIYDKMEDNVEYTARDLGVAPASMTAMVRRGLIMVAKDTSPKVYKKNSENAAGWVYGILAAHLPPDKEFFVLHRKDEKLGMLCSMKSNKVVDCWENPYDLANVISVTINKQVFER